MIKVTNSALKHLLEAESITAASAEYSCKQLEPDLTTVAAGILQL